MTIEKWKVVGGQIYKLERTFESMLHAVELARRLKTDRYVYLHRIDDGLWAVYWREKEQDIQCDPEYGYSLTRL
ncbi:MAG: hypothetical protein ACXADO_00090 [Candidatus Thorarchaeota archaeon]|jgi:hypothetical protein